MQRTWEHRKSSRSSKLTTRGRPWATAASRLRFNVNWMGTQLPAESRNVHDGRAGRECRAAQARLRKESGVRESPRGRRERVFVLDDIGDGQAALDAAEASPSPAPGGGRGGR